MKRVLFALLLAGFTQSVYGQIEVDSIFIYQKFKRAGTTAGLQYNHRELDSTQAKKVKLTDQEINEVKKLFKETKMKRYLQQKHGGDICHALIWFKGIRYRYVIEGDSSWARMVNLDTMRKWTLDELENVKGFQEIIKKNWP